MIKKVIVLFVVVLGLLPQVSKATDYYVVVSAFQDENLAKKYQTKLKEKGYEAQILYNPDRAFYYIYFEQISAIQTAQKEKEILRASGFENAWVFTK